MVSNRLDYCNSLLYGVSKSNIAKLQRIQNALCHIIFRLDKMSHVTPFLKKLHWLAVQHRILFKHNLLVFKAINLSQPPYLSALIRSRSLTRGNRLSISSTRPKKHIGRRGFAVDAPAEWNKLPQTLRSQQTIDGFRSQLKTHLFRLAYCLATNYHRVPTIARQNSDRYNFTKSSIPSLANKAQLFSK